MPANTALQKNAPRPWQKNWTAQQTCTALMQKRVGLFLCGMLPQNTEQQFKLSFPNSLLAAAVVKLPFGGTLNNDKFKFLTDRLLK